MSIRNWAVLAVCSPYDGTLFSIVLHCPSVSLLGPQKIEVEQIAGREEEHHFPPMIRDEEEKEEEEEEQIHREMGTEEGEEEEENE